MDAKEIDIREKKIDLIAGNISQSILQIWRGKPVILRKNLGDDVKLFALQEGIIGALIFSSGWDAAMYLSGVEFGKSTTSYLLLCADISESVKDFSKVETLDEARDSRLFKLWESFFRINKIGILSLIEFSRERLVFRVEECAFSYGLSDIGRKICYFNTGYLTGLVTIVLDGKFKGQETKCNANGDNYCEIVVKRI